MNFDKAFDRLLGHEGGFVDHPKDPGLWGKSASHRFKRCAALKSKLDRVPAAPPLFSPFSQRVFGPMQRKFARCSQVVRLLRRSGPSAISRLIPAVVIDSVNRHARRALAHCVEKCREVISPFVAYRDAATTPKVEARIVFVVAAVLHVSPHTISARLSQAVRPQSVGSSLFMKAPA